MRTLQADQISSEFREFIDRIPDPGAIRRRLEYNARETKLLRRLLRLAVDAEQTREARQEVTP